MTTSGLVVLKSSLNRLELNISDKPESKSQVQAQSRIDSQQVGHDGYVGHAGHDGYEGHAVHDGHNGHDGHAEHVGHAGHARHARHIVKVQVQVPILIDWVWLFITGISHSVKS